MKLPCPTPAYIDKLLKKYEDEYFLKTERSLDLLLKAFPNNNDYHEILIKVIFLNRLYNTNIYNPYTVAEHICNIGIDKRINKGELSIIDDISNVKFRKRKMVLYSFATKYCSWHKPEDYFIYDSYVDFVIWEYNKKYNFNTFYRYELKEYQRFQEILMSFINHFKLGGISKKKLDKFLWLEGKRIFGEL